MLGVSALQILFYITLQLISCWLLFIHGPCPHTVTCRYFCRQLTEKIEKRQRDLDRLEDQILAAETQGSRHQTKPKRTRERESGGRLSMDDLSPSPTPGRLDYDEDSEEELLEGELIDRLID